jgi:hypothetical protein
MNFVREGVLVVADILRHELRKIEKEKRKKKENLGEEMGTKE